MRAYFVSDIHIKTLNDRNAHLFLNFLRQIEKEPVTHLFLLGDIFDLWVGDHDFYYRMFQPIVDAILGFKNKGVVVHYFEGNHDLHVRNFWEGRYQIPVHTDPEYFEVGGKVLRIEHGDHINPNDKAYQRYRGVVRTPALEKLAQRLPPKQFFEFGKLASRISRKYSSRKRDSMNEVLREMIRTYAETAHLQKPFDWIFTGHVHVRDEWVERKFTSINLGSWFDEPAVYLLEGDGLNLLGTFKEVR